VLEFSEMDRAPLKRLVGHTLARIERELILETLRHCDGNRTRSADILGISLRSLRDRIRSYRAYLWRECAGAWQKRLIARPR